MAEVLVVVTLEIEVDEGLDDEDEAEGDGGEEAHKAPRVERSLNASKKVPLDTPYLAPCVVLKLLKLPL